MLVTIIGTSITPGTETRLSSVPDSGFFISAILLTNDNVFIAHSFTESFYLYAMLVPITIYVSPITSISDSAGIAKTAATAGNNVEIYSPA